VPAASPAPRRRSTRRRVALAASVLALLVVAGCSTPGQVDEYSDADFQVRDNFIDACLTANGDGDLTDAEAQTFCECWYTAIETEVPFDQFKKDTEAIEDAIDKGEFNNEDDFEREAPTTFRVGTEACPEQVGPSAN
jgi:hypothetical protein